MVILLMPIYSLDMRFDKNTPTTAGGASLATHTRDTTDTTVRDFG